MARMVSSEHEMQEVFQAAGKMLVVVYFFDVLEDPNRKELNKIAKSYGGTFVLAEINKWPDQNKDELFFATQELKRKYMPGAGMAPVLVFFHEGQQKHVVDNPTEKYVKKTFEDDLQTWA